MIPRGEIEQAKTRTWSAIQRLQLKCLFNSAVQAEINQIVNQDLKPALRNLEYALSLDNYDGK